jgi:hypothetical protein
MLIWRSQPSVKIHRTPSSDVVPAAANVRVMVVFALQFLLNAHVVAEGCGESVQICFCRNRKSPGAFCDIRGFAVSSIALRRNASTPSLFR